MVDLGGADRITVLIPAGGVGARLGSRTPKQFLALGGGPILATTVRHFARHPAVGAIVVAAPQAFLDRARRALRGLGRRVEITVVAGGPTRQEAGWLALQAGPGGTALGVLHRAVPPFIGPAPVDG